MDVYILLPLLPPRVPSNIWSVAIIHNKITHIKSEIISPILTSDIKSDIILIIRTYNLNKSSQTLFCTGSSNMVSKQHLIKNNKRGPNTTLTVCGNDG